MPLLKHSNIGDVLRARYLQGVLTFVDFAGSDTCSVLVEGVERTNVPIFYNCGPNAVLKANGALANAGTSFIEEDVVIVQELDGKYKVIGYADPAIKFACEEAPLPPPPPPQTLQGFPMVVDLNYDSNLGSYPTYISEANPGWLPVAPVAIPPMTQLQQGLMYSFDPTGAFSGGNEFASRSIPIVSIPSLNISLKASFTMAFTPASPAEVGGFIKVGLFSEGPSQSFNARFGMDIGAVASTQEGDIFWGVTGTAINRTADPPQLFQSGVSSQVNGSSFSGSFEFKLVGGLGSFLVGGVEIPPISNTSDVIGGPNISLLSIEIMMGMNGSPDVDGTVILSGGSLEISVL